jgi:FHA domain-containing protein/zinc ribbon protein
MARPERGALHCPECGFVNPEGANYCQKCGAFLAGEAHETGEPGGGAGETTMAYQLDESGDLHPVDLERVAAEGGTLVIRSGGGRAGETFELAGEQTRVGRSPEADVFLDDVTVSRNHALLVRRRDGVYIDDLGSLNGTYINRRRIESHKLEDGDELQIGKYKLTYLER